MPKRRRRRRRRWWSPAWRWRHRSSLRRHRTWRWGGARRPRRVRLAWGILGACGLLLLLAGAAVLYELSSIRSKLVAARETVAQAVDNPAALQTASGREATVAGLDSAVVAVTEARRRTMRSPALAPLRHVPVLRGQWKGLVTVVDDSAVAATAGRDLLARVDSMARDAKIIDGSVPLRELETLAGDAKATGQTMGRLVRTPSNLWGPLGDARRRLDELARSTSDRLEGAADALTAARSFLAADGQRRYLIALQNNAEMRDQGMVLSYALARFEGGRLSFEGSGPVADLRLTRPAPTPIPQATEQVFGFIAPTQIWQSVNATADFPWSSQAMVDMYRQATGKPIDGIIAIDVPGLAALLRVIGPVVVPEVTPPITAANAAKVLLHDLYEGLPPISDQSERKEKLDELTEQVIGRLTSSTQDPVALGRELGEAAKGGHLRLWSAAPQEEDVFERTGLGGGPATTDADRTFHLAVENRTATKLDYYVKPSVRQEVQLTRLGSAVVYTTVTVDNQAPVGAPPSYQLGPDENTKDPGDYLAWLLLWGPAGSSQPGGVGESGLVLTQYVTEVGAGERRSLTFETVIPDAVRDGRLRLRLVPQPRLEAVDLQIRLQAPGWDVEGATAWQGPWDRVITFTWEVGR